MSIQTLWADMSAARKAGLVIGSAVVVGLTAALAYEVLKTDYVPVITQASPEKLATAVREIEKLKIPYRVGRDGGTIEVPADQLGRVKVGVAGAASGGSSVGFEIFNNSDFSTTEFTQKVNYQRALQGELARTIASMDGIANARVHLVLADSGYSRRQQYRPTAAVTVAMQPGQQLVSSQIRGIQRLVAASVPDIKLTDIAVLDQAGEPLTKFSSGDGSEGQRWQLDLKREVDGYLEAKLKELLVHSDPMGEFSVSVDAALNLDDVKITQEDVLAPDDGRGGRSTGVLVKERQSQRQEGAIGTAEPASSPGAAGSLTRESEYRVGRRVEQVATSPGGIERISVAVVARTATVMDESRIRDLARHALGIKDDRGDAVAVVLLPASTETIVSSEARATAPWPRSSDATAGGANAMPGGQGPLGRWVSAVLGLMALALIALWVMGRRRHRESDAIESGTEAREPTSEEVDRIVQRVQSWLSEGKAHAS